uniref:G-protein coupled receptors family 1 profile domain-containing protein n=1 Tax=Periophthalmus magnuspinnatus TaxID=409849 RepID=A0A3B4BC46_9GOBI
MASANVSSSSSLTLAAYWDLGSLRSLWFLFLLLLYVAVLGCNLVVIAAIFVDRSLHQPMYVLICNLLTNQLCGSVAIYPFLLFQLLQSTHAVSHAACLVQVFFLFFYGNVQIMTLAAMSYDRYVAICCPLQYHRRMSSQRTLRLLLLVWLLPLLEVSFMVSLSAPLRLCGNHISKVYCDNYSVVKLACGDTTLNNVYGLIYTCVALLSVPALILYTYVRIIRVCLSSGASTRRKALSTCAPHLVVMTRFNVTAVPNAFDVGNLSRVFQVFLSLYIVIGPPLLNALLYGLNMSKLRAVCRGLLSPKI